MEAFYLGTNHANWLGRFDVSLMVSRRTLAGRRSFPRARTGWALDSGGFTELSMHGAWTVPAHRYIAEVRRFYDEVGSMDWAAGQDWMCEPWIVAKTGLTIREHLRRTVENYVDLKTWAPDLPIIPTLQGWQLSDYVECFVLYERAGVNLTKVPVVGLGSVCRRQATEEIGEIVRLFAAEGLRLHGFGCKAGAVQRYGHLLHSADSMAWSFAGRRIYPCPHTDRRKNCATCPEQAFAWRDRVLNATTPEEPLRLFDPDLGRLQQLISA